MPDATAALPIPAPAEERAPAVPAPQPDVPTDLAARLFDEEVAGLEARASVTSFIGVIAARRVKERLRKLASTK